MSTSKGDLRDARGVEISAGDVCIYGFGVSRSVAMAEGVVMADPKNPVVVSRTVTGLIRVRVVRRSYAQGEKPIVAIMSDRMVVLKAEPSVDDGLSVVHVLPWSPLLTQDEELYEKLVGAIERHLGNAERLSTGGELDDHERRSGYYPEYTYADVHDPGLTEKYLGWYREWEARDRKQLEGVCARLGKEMPV